jgi:hypothetical protein
VRVALRKKRNQLLLVNGEGYECITKILRGDSGNRATWIR